MLLVYKSRTKSFCSILYISTFKNFQKEKKKNGAKNNTRVILKAWSLWDRYISNNDIRVLRMHHKPAKFIASPHAAEFIISGVKSTNFM